MRVQYIFLQAGYSVTAAHANKPYVPGEPYDYSWVSTCVHMR